MLQASEVQEVQVLVEEEQEKAKTLDSIVVSLRSDLLLAREEQERLAERLRLQEKEASEREEVVEAALNKVREGDRALKLNVLTQGWWRGSRSCHYGEDSCCLEEGAAGGALHII